MVERTRAFNVLVTVNIILITRLMRADPNKDLFLLGVTVQVSRGKRPTRELIYIPGYIPRYPVCNDSVYQGSGDEKLRRWLPTRLVSIWHYQLTATWGLGNHIPDSLNSLHYGTISE